MPRDSPHSPWRLHEREPRRQEAASVSGARRHTDRRATVHAVECLVAGERDDDVQLRPAGDRAAVRGERAGGMSSLSRDLCRGVQSAEWAAHDRAGLPGGREGSIMKYTRIAAYVSDTLWALHPSKLGEIVALLAFRAAGHEYTDAEIAARIGDPRPRGSGATSRGAVAVIPIRGVIAHRI